MGEPALVRFQDTRKENSADRTRSGSRLPTIAFLPGQAGNRDLEGALRYPKHAAENGSPTGKMDLPASQRMELEHFIHPILSRRSSIMSDVLIVKLARNVNPLTLSEFVKKSEEWESSRDIRSQICTFQNNSDGFSRRIQFLLPDNSAKSRHFFLNYRITLKRSCLSMKFAILRRTVPLTRVIAAHLSLNKCVVEESRRSGIEPQIRSSVNPQLSVTITCDSFSLPRHHWH
jgi:hypothetical protein